MAVRRRVSFDLGSGAVKMCVADVDVAAGRVVRVLFAEERVVRLGESMYVSPTRAVAPAVVRLFHDTVAGLVAVADRLAPGAPRICIATAVFREASNGAELLAPLRQRHGVRVATLPQAEEALLGFMSGDALRRAAPGPVPAAGLIVWDSGASSFQLSERTSAGLRAVNGRWGSSRAVVAQRLFHGLPAGAATVHPVSRPQLDGFIADLQRRLEDETAVDRPWVAAAVAGGKELVCIGGRTSAFRCACLVAGTDRLSRDDVVAAAHSLVGKTDAEIAASARPLASAEPCPRPGAAEAAGAAEAVEAAGATGCSWEGVPLPEDVTAKLALAAAVMGALRLPPFRFFEAVGLTAGLMTKEDLWAAVDGDGGE